MGRVLPKIHSRFLQDSSTLHSSDEEGVNFRWGPDKQTTFKTLRQRLCKPPVLTLPEGVEDFVVFCDAYITGLGVVLMQRGLLIAYALR